MPQDRFSLLLYRVCLLGSLLGLTATLYFLGGMSGHIGNPLLNVGTASVLVSGAIFFLYIFFLLLPDKSWVGFLIWVLILTVLLAEVVLGLVPPWARDELIHHLAMPKLYLQAGRIKEIPFALHSYYPMLLDMLYTPFVKWGWDSIAKLIHGLFGFLTAILLYAYLAHRLNPLYGLLGFLFFVSTPVVLKLGNLAYVDLGLTFYSTASLLCLLRWVEEVESKQWLILSGVSAGFALATKPNGLLVFLLLFFLLVFILERVGEGKTFTTIGWSVLFLFLAFIPFSPWFFKNLSQTGNPFFPSFISLFGGGGGGEPEVGILTRRQLLYGESWWQIAALPLRVFFSGQDNHPQYFDGVLNPILILFLPWAFKGKWSVEKRLLFAFVLLYFLFSFFLVDLRIRYLLPIVPPLVLLLVYGIHNVYLRLVHPSLLFAVVLFLLAMNGVYLWGYFREVSPGDYLRGREGRDAFLGRMLPDYPAIQYINRSLLLTARVYLLFMGRRGYHYERDYFYDAYDNPWILLHMIQGVQGEGDIKLKLRERGLTHLLIREDLLRSFLGTNLTSEEQALWGSFANHHLKRLFQARGYSVYEIHG
ncbi:MAG: glycosyltransferase family 39 protein [Deltaproteobacteria bacterium]|nr:glycosyltransferase family 39 protein [Deltaproteobacteria bacterium]